MRRTFRYISILILLAGITFTCVTRWQAWFGNPAEPIMEDEPIDYTFYGFGSDSVPGFLYDSISGQWQDLRSRDTLRLLILGDVHNTLTHDEWEQLSTRHGLPDAYLSVGDLLERGYFYYAQALFRELSGTAFDSIPIITVPGNHEYRKGLIYHLQPIWYQLFENPNNGPQDYIGSTYYVDFKGLRIIALDTQGLIRLRDYTRVETWIHQTIHDARIAGQKVMVIMHHPIYSSTKKRQNYLLRWLTIHSIKYADIVIAGHDHNYMRYMPYINLNSSRKTYPVLPVSGAQSYHDGEPVYAVLNMVLDTILIHTYLVDNGQCIDSVAISH